MFRALKTVLLLVLASFTIASCSVDDSPTAATESHWTTIDFPGSLATQIQGMDRGVTVGNYVDASGWHPYAFDGKDWSTLDVPGGAMGIDGTNIIGNYFETNTDIQSGFLFDGEKWSTISMPGADNTAVYDLDGDRIVGQYYNSSSGSRGFFFDGVSWNTVDAPGAEKTVVTGIGLNKLAGNFLKDGAWHGFVFDGVTWDIIDAPDGSRITIWGINGINVFGMYGDHGFVYDGDIWTTFDFPGATSTQVKGLYGGMVYGLYYAQDKLHGFVVEHVFDNQ